MGKLKISVAPYPKKEIILVCRDCGNVVHRELWSDYYDYKRKMEKMKKYKVCTNCSLPLKGKEEKNKIKWEHTKRGYYQAQVLNGDFLVFKWGNGSLRWRWRFRKKGETFPEKICVASTKEEAMKACEKHEEWISFFETLDEKDKCVSCGGYAGEGQQICVNCKRSIANGKNI